jgi:hypothetical protein
MTMPFLGIEIIKKYLLFNDNDAQDQQYRRATIKAESLVLWLDSPCFNTHDRGPQSCG